MLTPRFFAEYWQKRVLHCPASGGDGLIDRRVLRSRTVSLEDVEFLVSSLGPIDPNWFQLVRAGTPLRPSAYRGKDGFPVLSCVYAAYESGHTIQLAKLHKRWPPVGRLCRAVDQACLRAGLPLAARVGAHLYLTPPRSTGLDPHYDNHDVLVLQLEGEKRWRVYGPRELHPTEMQAEALPRHRLPPLDRELTLRPGEVLYIPRGRYHEASAGRCHSLHLSLDLTAWTWSDLFAVAMRRRGALRESLPPGALAGGLALRREFARRAAALAAAERELSAMADELVARFRAGLDPLPGRVLSGR